MLFYLYSNCSVFLYSRQCQIFPSDQCSPVLLTHIKAVTSLCSQSGGPHWGALPCRAALSPVRLNPSQTDRQTDRQTHTHTLFINWSLWNSPVSKLKNRWADRWSGCRLIWEPQSYQRILSPSVISPSEVFYTGGIKIRIWMWFLP